MINYRLIGLRIKDIRHRQSMTQAKLAEMADLSTPYISFIENAVKKPRLEPLVNIANALGVTVDELLSGNQLHNPTDYHTDLDELMAVCTQNEKRLIFELTRFLVHLLHDNGWTV